MEHLQAGGGWVTVDAAELVVTNDAEEPAELLVLLRSGWQRGISYRVELTPALLDGAGRSFGANESLEWAIPAGTATDPDPPVAFEQRFGIRYESYIAASDQLAGRFPGGQNSLFQGLWTDPVTGVAYARARWYDGRNASWLSEDPYNAVDSPNLYAFVGWQPNMATDPEGEVALVDNVVGGVVSVAVGLAIEGLITWLDDEHEFSYTWKDAGVDFGLGFLTSGLSSVGKLKHLNKLGTASRAALRIGADAALDTVGEIARKEWKGEEYTTKEILTGAGFNFVIGESGALAAKAFKKLRRSFDFGNLGDAAARGIREGAEELAPSVSRASRNNAAVPRGVTFDPRVNRFRDVATGRFVKAPRGGPPGSQALIRRDFETLAPNRGFLGGFTTKETLRPGTVIDRFGGRGGHFTSPEGTRFSARGLPPENARLPFERFEVVEPLEVDAGIAGYAFGGGGGVQYELPASVQKLIDAGFLRVVK
ncbi:MAG: glycohydrolase toxin TNT-related protein [bacterium]|nr:glycohydrolase toxin TNT-related protein [bacterium]